MSNPEIFLTRKDCRKAILAIAREAQAARQDVDITAFDALFPAPVTASPAPICSDQIAAYVLWWGKAPLLPGRPYLLKGPAGQAEASISALKYRLDVGGPDHQAARALQAEEAGFCNLSLDHPLDFATFDADPRKGRFLLFDRLSGASLGLGFTAFGLRRATNLRWQHVDLDKQARARLKGQTPFVLWFTGLSGSGKSTLANLVEKRLHAQGRHTYLLDGDNVRHGLSRDLGFTDADRVENLRRVAETAKLFLDAGLIVMVSFISPFRAERRMARALFAAGEFLEVFVDTPLEICEARDEKGLYRKARQGLIKNFTGIDSAYEPPLRPDIHLDSSHTAPEELVEEIFRHIKRRGLIP